MSFIRAYGCLFDICDCECNASGGGEGKDTDGLFYGVLSFILLFQECGNKKNIILLKKSILKLLLIIRETLPVIGDI